ncbi:MAG: hypothetical protein FWD53_03005, partial [Phycisphaerales bacterium]|nr:hypothetical protein [Phycisphaerales bacterium]
TGDHDCVLSDNLTIECTFLAHDETQFSQSLVHDDVPIDVQVIEFLPTGQADPATITLTGPNNGEIRITSESRFDLYHIVQGEAR